MDSSLYAIWIYYNVTFVNVFLSFGYHYVSYTSHKKPIFLATICGVEYYN